MSLVPSIPSQLLSVQMTWVCPREQLIDEPATRIIIHFSGKYHLLDAINFVLAREQVYVNGTDTTVTLDIKITSDRHLTAQRRVIENTTDPEFFICGKVSKVCRPLY